MPVPGGVPARLAELGELAVADAVSYVRTSADGREAVLVNVVQQPSANTVAIARGVRELLARHPELIPKDVGWTIFYDQAEFITHSIGGVRDAILIGVALAALVLLALPALLEARPGRRHHDSAERRAGPARPVRHRSDPQPDDPGRHRRRARAGRRRRDRRRREHPPPPRARRLAPPGADRGRRAVPRPGRLQPVDDRRLPALRPPHRGGRGLLQAAGADHGAGARRLVPDRGVRRADRHPAGGRRAVPGRRTARPNAGARRRRRGRGAGWRRRLAAVVVLLAPVAATGYLLYRAVETDFLPAMDEGSIILDYWTPPGHLADRHPPHAARGREGDRCAARRRRATRGAPGPSSASSSPSRTAATTSSSSSRAPSAGRSTT